MGISNIDIVIYINLVATKILRNLRDDIYVKP